MSDSGTTHAGTHKVAAFLLSLEKEVATGILKHLRDDVLIEVAQAMTEFDPEVFKDQGIDGVWRDLALAVNGPKRLESSDEQGLSEMLGAALGPQRAELLLEQIHARRLQERPFLSLEEVSADRLGRVLQVESAAVTALVLAHLEPSVSATVLSAFETELALDVVSRMASLTPPGFDTLQAIAADISARIESLGTTTSSGGPEERLRTIAEMLGFVKEDVELAVLDGLSEQDDDIASEIREFMFTWDDIATIDKRSMQKVLGSVDTRALSVSLKGSNPAVEANVMANLSARVRDMVGEERELAGAMPMSEVLAARNEIMLAVRKLMESGDFRPSRQGEDLVS
jgi:flagellar motor switch protein FliG